MGRRVTRVDLEANVTVFKRGTREARDEINETRRTAQRFAKGRYEAKVGADTKTARADLSALEKRLQAYGKSSAEARVNLDTDEARDRLTAVQTRLAAFGRQVAEAKADVDDDEAQGKLSRIEASLLSLGRQTANPKIDLAGVARAEANLAGLEAKLRAVDGDDIVARIRVDGTARASRQMSALIDFGFMLGPAFIAGGGAAAGALAGVAGSATMALGAVAPLALAFSGVGDALEAMDAVQVSAAQNAREHAREQVLAARSIADARRGVASAELDASRSIADARLALSRAEQDAAYASVQSADRVEDAQQDVASAERDLADAHRDVDDALEDLHESRGQAIRDLQDLREAQGDNNLSIEAAKIRLIEARQELNRLSMAEGTTALDMRKARLAVREAEDALSDAKRESRRDTEDLRKAERDGVNGSDAVVDARNRVQTAVDGVRDAQQRLRETQEALAESEAAAARQDVENARNIADARKTLRRAMEDGSISIAEAQRTLRRAVGDANYNLSQQTTEMQNLHEAMAELSPAGREFVRFLFDELMPKLDRLKAVAQEGLLPGVETGLTQLMDEMPRFKRIVDSYSKALGQLAEEGGDALTDPFWRDYFDFIGDEADDSMVRMGRAVGNFVEGFAALHEAFFPLQRDMEKGVLGWSRAFSKWAKNVDDTERFQDFLDYVERVGPKAMDVVEAVADALLAVAEAAAPIGEATLPVIEALARVIEKIAASPAGPPLVAMAAGLAAVNRTLRVFEAVKASNLVTTFGDMGRTSDRSASKVDRFKDSARGLSRALAGGAGVVALSMAVGESNDKLRAFEGAIGGALLGFSVAGPPGALIGGIAGGFAGLAADTDDAAVAMDGYERQVRQANRAMKDAIDTIDTLNGRFTEQTRVDVGRNILEQEQFGSLRNLLGRGASLNDLVSLSLMPEKGIRRTEEWSNALKAAAKWLAPLRSDGESWSHFIRTDVVPNLNMWIGGLRNSTEGLRSEHEMLQDVNGRLSRNEKHIRDSAEAVDLNDRRTKLLNQTLQDASNRTFELTGKSRLNERQLRDVADQMDLTRGQTRKLINEYLDVPENIHTKPHFDDEEARHKTEAFVKFVGKQWDKLGRATVSAGFFGEDTTHVTGPGGIGHGQYYAGGYTGPGGKYEPAGVVHRDEFVISKDARQRLESEAPGSLDYMNRTGMWPGYFDGGRVAGPTVKVQSDFSDLRQAVREFVQAMSMAGGRWIPGVSDRRVGYSGVTLDYYTFQRLRAAEKMIGQRFDLTQGSFSTSVAASGGTHAGGGAFDADSPFSRAAVVALRKYGVAAWRRYPSQGPWGTHIHGIALGDKIASPAAKQQMQDYLSGGDGLGGRDYEPRPNVILPLPTSGQIKGRSPAAAKQYALSRFGLYNWNPDRQWSSLNKLWERESNWRWNALNESSGAYGIPQSLPASKMASAGPDWRTNPATQVDWGLGYIHDRYRTPLKAWAHSQSVGWYDRGGPVGPGTTVVHNGTGRTEEVLTPVERDAFAELGKWAHMSKYQATAGSGSGGLGGPMRLSGDLNIKNWQTGQAYFQGIAVRVTDGNAAHAGTMARMG